MNGTSLNCLQRSNVAKNIYIIPKAQAFAMCISNPNTNSNIFQQFQLRLFFHTSSLPRSSIRAFFFPSEKIVGRSDTEKKVFAKIHKQC